MIAFFLAAAIALLAAVAFAAVPLLRRDAPSADVDRHGVNVGLFRQRAAEIEIDRAAGQLSDGDAAALTQELGATLLDDATANESTATPAPRSVGAAAALGVAIVAVSLALYHSLGAYDAVRLRDAAAILRDETPPPEALRDLTQRLRARVATAPEEAESWYLLGHALMRQNDAAGAVTAFERLAALAGDDPTVRIALAQARFAAADGTLTDQNRALVEQILADDPQQSIALEMLALDAFRRADYATAARYIETALSGGAAGARAESLQQGLERARALLAAAGGTPAPALDVTIEVGDAARDLPAGAALFIYARKPGERMPLLVARRAVTGESMTVRLDQANAMSGSVSLVDGEVLDVAARLSASGSVTSSSGDAQASREGVALRSGVTAVNLALSRANAAAVTPLASVAAPPRQPPPATAIAIHMNVALAPGVTAPPPARVFVIARAPSGPPMPIAVRALDPTALPEQLELTDRDAMQPARVLSMFDRVEVLARLSRSGNPVRASGDVESAAVSLDPRDAKVVSLIIGG